MSRNARGGFALIELLVVVAVIGLLLSMALTYFMGARNSARLTAADGHAKNVLTAGYAHLAEDTSNTISAQTCTPAYIEGRYTIAASANSMSSCDVTIAPDGTPIVTYQANVPGAPVKTLP